MKRTLSPSEDKFVNRKGISDLVLNEGHSLAYALSIWHKLEVPTSYKFAPASAEEIEFARAMTSRDGQLPSIKNIKDSFSVFGFSFAFIIQLLVGHSYKTIKKEIDRAKARAMAKEEKAKIREEISRYLEVHVVPLGVGKIYDHVPAKLHLCLPKTSRPVPERFEAFMDEKQLTPNGLAWSVMGRNKFKPGDGLKFFLRDRFNELKLPNAIEVESCFSSFGKEIQNEVFQVSSIKNSIVVAINHGASPKQVLDVWDELVDVLMVLLDTRAKANGFTSIDEWISLEEELCSYVDKLENKDDYDLRIERRRQREREYLKAEYGGVSPDFLHAITKDSLCDLPVWLGVVSRYARTESISSKDSKALFRIKQVYLEHLVQSGIAKVRGHLKIANPDLLNETHLKNKNIVVPFLLERLLDKNLRLQSPALASLLERMVEQGAIVGNIIGDMFEVDMVDYNLFMKELVSYCTTEVGPQKDITFGKVLVKLFGNIQNVYHMIDQSTMGASKLMASGRFIKHQVSKALNEDYYDVWVIELAGFTYYLPLNLLSKKYALRDNCVITVLNERPLFSEPMSDEDAQQYPLAELLKALHVSANVAEFTPNFRRAYVESVNTQ